jgi:hypothetical protein
MVATRQCEDSGAVQHVQCTYTGVSRMQDVGGVCITLKSTMVFKLNVLSVISDFAGCQVNGIDAMA